jgi:hypothetical protein
LIATASVVERLELVEVQRLETILGEWQVEALRMGVVRERYLGRMMARLDRGR